MRESSGLIVWSLLVIFTFVCMNMEEVFTFREPFEIYITDSANILQLKCQQYLSCLIYEYLNAFLYQRCLHSLLQMWHVSLSVEIIVLPLGSTTRRQVLPCEAKRSFEDNWSKKTFLCFASSYFSAIRFSILYTFVVLKSLILNDSLLSAFYF